MNFSDGQAERLPAAIQPPATTDWVGEVESWDATHEAVEKTLQAFFVPNEDIELRNLTKSGVGSGVYTNYHKVIGGESRPADGDN